MSPRYFAKRAGRIAWSVTIALVLLCFVGLVVAQQAGRAYCDGDVCVITKQDLIELLHRSERAMHCVGV